MWVCMAVSAWPASHSYHFSISLMSLIQSCNPNDTNVNYMSGGKHRMKQANSYTNSYSEWSIWSLQAALHICTYVEMCDCFVWTVKNLTRRCAYCWSKSGSKLMASFRIQRAKVQLPFLASLCSSSFSNSAGFYPGQFLPTCSLGFL